MPPQSIGLSGDGLELPPDQATLLGAALLECLGVLIGRREPMARLDLEFRRRGRGVALRVAEIDDPNDGALEHLAEGRLLRAVIEQLGARLVYAGDEQGGALEIHFQPGGHAGASLAQQVTLH